MAAPTWNVGQIVTASDVNNWFVGDYAIRTTDLSRASLTTLTADPTLVLPVIANASYWFFMYIDYEGGTQGSSDLKFNYTIPGSAFMRYQISAIATTGTIAATQTRLGSDTIAVGSSGAGVLMGVMGMGTLVNGAGSGNLTFNWAQNTSNTTATTIHAQSAIALIRIS